SEPVYLTVNGRGDLVVMDIDAFEHRERMLKIREDLVSAEEDRRKGFKGYSIDETYEMMMETIEEYSANG
ncbi:MAG: type II toxin-antitoxin system Phd/YefM family antitoxin, partial [Oscillospiraceae bacterium]|nr:type II toxin-antitoxin system Phd/YefM family antitoxin [Oscillospiraceae bacterium]